MSATGFAAADTPALQAHFRSGLIQGNFSGSTSEGEVSGDFSAVTSMDLEFEYFADNQSSYVTRATILGDQSTGELSYFYMGLGYKRYIFSQGRYLESLGDELTFSIVPKWRYYVQGDVGLANVKIEQVTESLSAEANLVELGGSGGVIYQMTKSTGIEAIVGVSSGVPISSIAVSSLVIKVLIGATAYF